MSGLEVVLLALAVAAAAAGVVVSLRARRLDRLHQTVVKSRRALELALRARAQYARDFAGSGTLDVAGGILLTDAAEACLSKGMLPIVDDGLDGIDLEFASRGVADDRRSIESSLSRTLRLTVDELAQIRRSVDVPIAADESIRRAEDPLEVARKEAADVVIIKVAPLGGVRAALKVARKSGLGVVVSSALETSVGLSVGVAAAAAVPGVPRAAGLATASLLVGDVTQPLIPERGCLPVGRLEPDQELIDRTPVDGDLVSRWGMRLEGMAEHLRVGSR